MFVDDDRLIAGFSGGLGLVWYEAYRDEVSYPGRGLFWLACPWG